MRNWAGNTKYQAMQIERPATREDVAALVRAADRVHGLGSRHCFNDIADTRGVLISTEHLREIGPLNTTGERPTITVESGVTYGQLGPALQAVGYALPNLASLPHVTIAGATATATHGSGEGNGCLSTSVAAVEFVTAAGELTTVSRGEDDFDGVVVHLGALGVVTRLTLDLVPTFDIEQTVYDRVPLAGFVENLDAIAGSVYSVSGFTEWQGGLINQVWMKALAGVPHFDLATIGGTKADGPRHPIEGHGLASDGAGTDACTPQLGKPGAWHKRLTHFRIEFTPSSGDELQSEYFVGREHAAEALNAVARLGDQIGPAVQVSEIRLIAADALWMSPFYQRPSVAIHFTWKNDWPAVRAVLPQIEAVLDPFKPRPHWGKLFTMPNDVLAGRTPNLERFRALRKRCDPDGKFANAYLERHGL